MADLVPEVLEQLSSISALEKRHKVRMAVRVKKEVKNLISHLRDIRAELADAEKKEWKYSSIEDWLDKLREVCYDMEDVLDDWNTAILKKQSGYAPTNRRKVCSLIIRFCCFACDQDDLLSGIASRIRNLNEKVEDIVMEKIGYGFNFEKSIEQKFTPSVIEVPLIRETDKNRIKDLLISQGTSLDVISIVGGEGIGKSALAREVFNDDEVKVSFEKRIWVCVNPFDLSKIKKTLFESLVRGEKFLLVLDDVREEDYENLEQLIISLEMVSLGSKILVTTRYKHIAIKSQSTIILLENFSEKECWSLFTKAAFHERARSECENLEEIGKKIVDKCEKFPIAILTIGSLLRLKKSKEEWQGVLNSEVWELKEVGKGHFAPLLLSYYDLPSKIRRCFLYCANFPKDFVLMKDEMIKLWMAQGYLRATQSKDLEKIGQECFDNLAAHSFFQDVKKDRKGNVIEFRMHDIIYDFAKFLAKNECVKMEFSGPKEGRYSCKKTPHLVRKFSKLEGPFSDSFDGLEKLRSLLVEFKGHSIVGSDLFNKLTCLRALGLSEFSDGKVADKIGSLMHLRYLDLSNNDHLIELPETICELFNLQTLDVSHCSSLGKLPSGIGKLINLRYLKNEDTEKLTFMPKGIERLTSLRELAEFVVSGGGSDGEAAALGDLKNLNQLRKYLKIRGLGNVRDEGQASKAQLKNTKRLVTLILNFDTKKEVKETVYDEKVMEALEPPPDLEDLEIKSYRGITMSPNWMLSLTKLWKLCLSNCMKCEHLPPLGKLPSLEYLEIKQMQCVKMVGLEFLGIAKEDKGVISAFPKLRELRFSNMEKWEDWDAGEKDDTLETTKEDNGVMPSLLLLDIQCCPKLKALPTQILHGVLKELNFNECSILKGRYHWLHGKDWNNIAHIPIVRIDGKGIIEDLIGGFL